VKRPTVINARAAARARITGVERWAQVMTTRLPTQRPGAYAIARPPASLAHWAGHTWEQAVLPLRAARLRAGLVFSPANLAPVAWPRNVVVVHDALAVQHPELYSAAYALLQRRLLPRIVRRARKVITVSNFSRTEISRTFAIPAEEIAVIPGGVDDRFSPDADPEPVGRALGLQRPYVLTVGAGGRKNAVALGVAARRLRDEGVELVAAGAMRPHMRGGESVNELRHLGYVADEHLPGLYAGAAAFVLPSLHEGFGLPCIEAMAAGTPVVAADRGALPETCAGAAVLVNPDDREEVADALLSAISDDGLRSQLRAAGLARASELSWDRTATAVDALLQDLGDRQ
jgi:glycosyltransferase involved in cell wall biosynthesis